MKHPGDLVFLFPGKVNDHIPAADHIKETTDRLDAYKIVRGGTGSDPAGVALPCASRLRSGLWAR